MVWKAKLKEVASRCQHKSFAIRKRADLGFRPMGGRWVLTWKLLGVDTQGRAEWGVKARLVCQGFSDHQKFSLDVYSPTAARLAQRI